MAATTHATGRLGEAAQDLRASAGALEGFATTLHHRAATMAWRGGAADRFRSDLDEQAQLTARATTLLSRLASRMTAVEEQVDELRARLERDEHQLHDGIQTEIKRLEQFMKAHPGAPLPQAGVRFIEGAVQASRTIAGDVNALQGL